MGKKPSVIEINNKRYDAITGQLLGAVKTTNTRVKSAAKSPVIDGLFQNKVATVMHQRAQRSKTLMRAAVARPTARQKAVPAPAGSAAHTKAGGSHRLAKAMNVTKNTHVRHFSSRQASSQPNRPLSGEIINRQPVAAAAAVAIRPMPGLTAGISNNRLERILDEALMHAGTKNKGGHLSVKPSILQRFQQLPAWAIITAVVLVFAATAAIFAWRFIPQASIKVASVRAHVNGSLPAYVPSGFKFAGPIKYANGAVSLKYQGSEGKIFTIDQQASSLNSESLEANAVPRNSQVQTSHMKGATVFIFDSNTHATWVTNGVRYTIKDASAKLSSGQLLKIADSL